MILLLLYQMENTPDEGYTWWRKSTMAKKILGLSFGRRNERSDIFVKEALLAAKEAGAEVKFINTMRLEVTHCHACDYCSKCRDKGDVNIPCAFKDGYQVLEAAFDECDGVIVAAPVYAVGITGQFKNFLDRYMPAHDRANMIEENKKREAEGKPLLNPNYFKDRYSGYISVGGAQTHNWVALGLPMLHLLDFSQLMKCVGHIDAYDQGRTGNPVLDPDLLEQCRELGRAVANSIGKPYDEVDAEANWVGPKGVCPVCHNDLITYTGTTHIECPICGINGTLSVEGEEVKVSFSEDEKKRARNTIRGIYEHHYEIKNMIDVCVPKLIANKEFIDAEKKKYREFDKTVEQW